MNIGHILQNMLGEWRTAGAKALELRSGQTVKGTVVRLLGDGEAIVQIQGTPVKARLEASLRQGETALLQVSGERDAGGHLVLRQVSAASLAASSIHDLLQEFKLPDRPEHRLLLGMMKREGVPLNNINVGALVQSLAMKPDSVPVQSWIETGMTALQRRLPMTSDSLNALHQVLTGPGPGKILVRFREQIQSLLQQLPASSTGALPGLLRSLDQAISRLMRQSAVLAGNPAGNPDTPKGNHDMSAMNRNIQAKVSSSSQQAAPFSAETGKGAGQSTIPRSVSSFPSKAVPSGTVRGTGEPGVAPGSPAMGSDAPGSPVSGRNDGSGMAGRQTASGSNGPAGNAAGAEGSSRIPTNAESAAGFRQAHPPASSFSASPGVRPQAGSTSGSTTGTAESRLSAATPGERPVADSASFRQEARGVFAEASRSGVEKSRFVPSNGAESSIAARAESAWRTDGNTSSPPRNGAPLLLQMFKVLGLDHETSILRQWPLSDAHAGSSLPPGASVSEIPAAGRQDHSADSIKSLLMQLQGMDEAPAALKESAQQLTQQLTGQQLLLSTERNATFTQITVLVPLVHEDGEQTAAISIQSRKNAKGELDSENCRLLFDLHMKWLGNTIADVMVTDKQVHLKILNDHPGIGSLLDHGANRLAEALESLGYKLASLQTDAYPALAPEQREEEGLHNRARSPAFRTAAYKGVDLRI